VFVADLSRHACTHRRAGKELSLSQVFESLQMTSYSLSLDMLDVHADNSTLHRFDRFNLKYNPCGKYVASRVFGM
jgi:AMP deaminase